MIPLMRCNIWHVRGRDRDLVVDTGMGFMSLSDELADLVDKDVTAVATHGHDDHIGGHHEFDDVRRPSRRGTVAVGPADLVAGASRGMGRRRRRRSRGRRIPDARAVLRHRACPPAWRRFVPVRSQSPACGTSTRATRSTSATGASRCIASARSLTGFDRVVGGTSTGTLFSGDAIYDGPLLDELPESSIDDYCTTMDRLMTLAGQRRARRPRSQLRPRTAAPPGHGPICTRRRAIATRKWLAKEASPV